MFRRSHLRSISAKARNLARLDSKYTGRKCIFEPKVLPRPHEDITFARFQMVLSASITEAIMSIRPCPALLLAVLGGALAAQTPAPRPAFDVPRAGSAQDFSAQVLMRSTARIRFS